MVDVRYNTNEAESQPDKELGQPIWLGQVRIIAVVDNNNNDCRERSSGAIPLERWWT